MAEGAAVLTGGIRQKSALQGACDSRSERRISSQVFIASSRALQKAQEPQAPGPGQASTGQESGADSAECWSPCAVGICQAHQTQEAKSSLPQWLASTLCSKATVPAG